MNKNIFYTILALIFVLFLIGVLVYPIFYNSSDNDENNYADSISVESQNLKEIDVLSNLSFFKILVADDDSSTEHIYSEKFVTIRDSENISKLQEMIKTATHVVTDEARGYSVPTTALCYLEDNTMYSFFVIDSNMVVFCDNDSNKTVYKLDEQYDIDGFLTTLYNVNVNTQKYSTFDKNGKVGIKYNNKNIIDAKYDDIALINPNLDVFAVIENETTTFIDKYEENPFPNLENIYLLSATGGGESLWYENALKFELDGKFGLISLDGSILLPAEYDDIKALNYVKDYLIIIQNGKEKVIKLDSFGFEELTPEFDEIKILGADLDYTSKDEKYFGSNKTIIVGINNNVLW